MRTLLPIAAILLLGPTLAEAGFISIVSPSSFSPSESADSSNAAAMAPTDVEPSDLLPLFQKLFSPHRVSCDCDAATHSGGMSSQGGTGSDTQSSSPAMIPRHLTDEPPRLLWRLCEASLELRNPELERAAPVPRS